MAPPMKLPNWRMRFSGDHQQPSASPKVRNAKAALLCLALVVGLAIVRVTAAVQELPDDGVALGSWSDDTSRYFGASATFTHADNTKETVTAPPLRVLALVDWQSQRRTELLSTWPNRSSVTLWANRDLARSLVPRARDAALVYRSIWGTESLPVQAATSYSTAPNVVSAAGADLMARGDMDVVLQASDGSILVLNRSSVSEWTRSSAFEWISLADDSLPSSLTRLKEPMAPSLSIVNDFWPRNETSEAAEVGIAFVNADDQLVLLSRVAGSSWPPRYTPHILADEQSAIAGRAVLPLSIVSADVNEDCAAELLYAVRDARQHLYEVHLFNTASVEDSSEPNGTLLLQLPENGEEAYGDSFTVADVNGDGLPELVVAVQLSNHSSSCASADAATAAETCTAFHAVRIFYPTRTAGVEGPPRCRSGSSSSDRHLSYNVSNNVLFELTHTLCGVETWRANVTGSLPLYMPSFPSAPLILRPGDYNRDRLVDLVVPSSHGPLLLTSRDVNGARPLVCTPLDSSAGEQAVLKALMTPLSSSVPPTKQDAYRTATPFFATLALLGRLEVVLTHHRLYTSIANATAMHQVLVYQNSQVPSRSYFLSATALTKPSYRAGCIGSTHHMTWQDIHMHSHWATATQQGRTQGHALLPPHVLIGLDETFSYVHEYTVALRASVDGVSSVQSKEWSSYLIPNAQVFAEVFPVSKPAKWSVQLYLPTSTYRRLLVIALAVALVIIGLPVIWLRCGEMRHDYNEWRMP